MGMITVEMRGSFEPQRIKTFSALNRGHACAVADCIRWLAESVLPKAIRQDHDLADEGHKPDAGFGRSDDD